MADNWTPAEEVINSWIGPDAPEDEDLIDTWIGRAERSLRSKIPDLKERIDDEEEDLKEKVQDVVVAAVQRVFRNPEGVRQSNTTTGPFTDSVTYGGEQPGALWFTQSELYSLYKAKRKRGGFSVDMMPLYSGGYDHDRACSALWGGYCTCGSELNGRSGPIWRL